MQIGTLEAKNLSEAYETLQFQGLSVVNIAPEESGVSFFLSELYKKIRLGDRWRADFFRELSVILGVMNLHDALQTLSRSAGEKFSEQLLENLTVSIENGETFATAIKRHEIIFGSDAIQSVEVGETGGQLQTVTAQLADRLERSYTTQKKVRGAMYYPIVVLIAAVIATIVMANVTLPVFEEFYRDQGGELPLITVILFSGGKFLTEHLILIFILAITVIFFAIVIYYRIGAVKYFCDKMKWRIKIFREIELRNFFGRLSFLLESGVILNEAINLYKLSNGDLFVKNFLDEVQISVEHGEKLGAALKNNLTNLPSLYLGLISTGEESGELSEMLRQCESMADFEIEETLRSLPAKAEVYGTLIAGIIVGALVFSIVLPILNMTDLF